MDLQYAAARGSTRSRASLPDGGHRESTWRAQLTTDFAVPRAGSDAELSVPLSATATRG
jgi:hypothetical protein